MTSNDNGVDMDAVRATIDLLSKMPSSKVERFYIVQDVHNLLKLCD